MRYIIIGAGAIGGTIGGRLFDSGREVVLVARGAHYEALRDGGLRLTLPSGSLKLPIPVVDGPKALELRADDVLVLAVKTQDSVAALDAWAGRPVVGGGTAGDRLPVVCAQNGVAGERLALRRFRRVYGMCVWLPASYLEPGSIEASCAPLTGILHIGRFPAGATGTSGADPLAERIATDLKESGFDAPTPPDVMRWKYGKLLKNLANALEATCGPLDGDDAHDVLRRAVVEGEAVLDAAGIDRASDAEQTAARGDRIQLQPLNGVTRGGGSSWQSLTRGTGSIEADYLNGEIVLLGRMAGIDTPVNAALQRIANAFAREGRRPGELTIPELTALIDSYERTQRD
ncbi:ketopantoate reductase family protein [Streptomyces sp. SID13666]|uniref:2-dehydropantoate 2-reductase N-terminal domain-containing protein n=1 Tax=unclassified Streptomyces TaxID=2593676 RepID=UPI0013C0FFBA|nr:ketopantoate reductase family protein [Streptomyces sp. SID13666]NEA73965.1 ketopantoate reductase family protein [Streptomyces sp. SID13588]